ncbi:MAG: hypothetical protein HQ568_05960 [Calditrichaeota bacterium]|nr:hypothetical protein [Calditrichota bacterium]
MKWLFSIGLSLLSLYPGSLKADEEFIWPVDAKPAITSSFGEFRSGHFHSGIDLKVYGSVGLPCRAVADGWVSRVKVKPGGYGKALYLRLNDTRTAVYAHLDRFIPEIEDIIHRKQDENGEYRVDIYFEEEEALHFKAGDIVCYDGRSGTKHPHVHFEIRDESERPLNALFQGFMLDDHIPPTPVALAVEPLDGHSTVEMDCQPRIWSKQFMRRNDGVWSPRDPIGVSGKVGISVDAFDKMDAAENFLAVYKAEMFINGEKRWETCFDGFSFDENSLMEVERNYRLYRRGKGVFHRLYHAPGNELDFCVGNGIIDTGVKDAFSIECVIQLSDAAGNETRIELTLVPDEDPDDDRLVTGKPLLNVNGWGKPASGRIELDLFGKYIRLVSPPGIEGFRIRDDREIHLSTKSSTDGKMAVWIPSFKAHNTCEIAAINRQGAVVESISIDLYPVKPSEKTLIASTDGVLEAEIPKGVAFENTLMRVIPEPAYVVPGEIESVYLIEPRDMPLAGAVEIRIKPDNAIDNRSDWGVYYLDKRTGWTWLGNSERDGFLTAPALSWEIFGLVVDRDMPYVRIKSPKDGQSLTQSSLKIEVAINDTTSGISYSDLTMSIDGKKVPAEYDAPRKRLLFKPWNKLSIGEHELTVRALDRVGHETVKSLEFNILP